MDELFVRLLMILMIGGFVRFVSALVGYGVGSRRKQMLAVGGGMTLLSFAILGAVAALFAPEPPDPGPPAPGLEAPIEVANGSVNVP